MQRRTGYALSLSLTLLRLALAPVALIVARDPARAPWIAVILVVGFVSDLFDGIVARRANAQTAGLRVMDSLVDTVFYLAIVASAWRCFPAQLSQVASLVVALIAFEVANYGAAFLKFRKSASYHAYSAKAMGIGLFGALGTLFLWGSTVFIVPALVVTLVAQVEVAAITTVLPVWHHDVRSVLHAWRIRIGASR